MEYYCRISNKYRLKFDVTDFGGGHREYVEYLLKLGYGVERKPAQFKTRLKTYTKGVASTKAKYYKNTKANRKKFLK